MTEWHKCKISDIGTVIGGATPSTKIAENYDNGTIAWITPKDLSSFNGRYIKKGERNITEIGLRSCSTQLLPQNTVLFSSRAPIGYIAIAENEVCTNQGFKSIIPNENTDPLFLFYLLKYNKESIESMGSGTTFKEVSGNTMKNIVVIVPSDINVQRKIAQILGSIDDKIEENEKINENLRQQMLLLVSQAKESSDWELQKLDVILEFYDSNRKPLSSRQRDGMEKNYPYYGATTIVDYVENYIFDGTYILVSEDGANVVDAQGHPLVQYTHGKFWLNNHAHIVKGKNGCSEALIFALLASTNMNSIVTGAAQPKINQANLRGYETLIPTKSQAEKLSEILNPMLSLIIANDISNQRLSQLRDSMLSRLMSGELDVSEIDL